MTQGKLDTSTLQIFQDEEWDLKATDLVMGDCYVIRASMQDDRNITWAAYAKFEADEEGLIDLRRATPIEGSYSSPNNMGLIWSMTAEEPDPEHPNFSKENLDPKRILISLEKESEHLDSITLTQVQLIEGTQIEELNTEGLVGKLFLPNGSDKCTPILVLGGSGGGLHLDMGAILSGHGYATLSLAYFRMPGLPDTLKEQALEYFERAMIWLLKHPRVKGNKVTLVGASRGGELVTLLGSLFPKLVRSVVAYVPSSVSHGGFPETDKPAWTFQGKPLPIAPMGTFEDIPHEEGTPLSGSPYFFEGMKKEGYEEAAIPVEKMECPLLLISGEDDQMWPGTEFSNQIMERLKQMNSKIFREHFSYPDAGHILRPPYHPASITPLWHPVSKVVYTIGGKKEAHALACEDSWRKVLTFLSKG